MNLKKILWMDERLPKSNYILRTFVGIYLIYIVYQIMSGLGEENVTNPTLVIVLGVVIGAFCIYCLLSGSLGLIKKTYREAVEEREFRENRLQNDDDSEKENK